jgi:hypothetical protein
VPFCVTRLPLTLMFKLNIVVSGLNLVFGRWGSVDCVIKGIKYIYLTLERRKKLGSAGLFIWRARLIV